MRADLFKLFFGLNLLSNAIMWILFTRALTAASSTTRVSVLNTAANFMVTAVLGMAVFREKLPGLWWVGAAFLVAGSVVIGMRGEEAEVDDRKDVVGVNDVPFTDNEQTVVNASEERRYVDQDEDQDKKNLR